MPPDTPFNPTRNSAAPNFVLAAGRLVLALVNFEPDSMKNIGRSTSRGFLNIRLIPVVIAAVFLISVPLYFGVACFYNWELQWQTALMLWIAALGLWLGSWWSKLIAIGLSGFLLYRFIRVALKVHGVVALSPEEEVIGLVPPEVWWGFIIRSPWEYIPLILATLILVYSAVSIGVEIHRRRFTLP